MRRLVLVSLFTFAASGCGGSSQPAGGLDAGSPDGGAAPDGKVLRDGGTEDAAQAPDAGMADAGMADAGMADAGMADAGSRFDGGEPEEPAPPSWRSYGVSMWTNHDAVGCANGDAWILADSPQQFPLAHLAGDSTVIPATPVVPREANLRGIWGLPSCDELWAVGEHESHALVLRFDGSRWEPVELPPSLQGELARVHAVTGNGDGDVWIAGSPPGGAPWELFRFDGTTWQPVERPEPMGIDDLVATDEALYVVGGLPDPSGVYRLQDGTWQHFPVPRRGRLSGTAVGDELWVRFSHDPAVARLDPVDGLVPVTVPDHPTSIAPDASGEGVVVGARGIVHRVRPGPEPSSYEIESIAIDDPLGSGHQSEVNAIWHLPDGRLRLAVDNPVTGGIIEETEDGFRVVDVGLHQVSGDSSGHLRLVGEELYFAGNEVFVLDTLAPASDGFDMIGDLPLPYETMTYPREVDVLSDGTIVAASPERLYAYRGSAWQLILEEPPGGWDPMSLWASSDELYLAIDRPLGEVSVAHGELSSLDLDSSSSLGFRGHPYGLWGTGGEVFLAGSATSTGEPYLMVHQAGEWSRVEAPEVLAETESGWFDVHGTDATNVWVVGSRVLHRDTTGWHDRTPPDFAPDPFYFRVFAAAPDEVYVATPQWQVLRWDGTEWSALDVPPNVAATGGSLRSIVKVPDGRLFIAGDGGIWSHRVEENLL